MEENQKQQHHQNNDNSLSLNDFIGLQEKNTDSVKNLFAQEIINNGGNHLAEISRKKELENTKKKPLIEYILSKSDKYTEEQLYTYEYKDIEMIHSEIKERNRSFLGKIFKFINS